MRLKLHFQALADLFKQYRVVFRQAWAQRAELTPPERLPHEAQFLPAALALQETPVSPAPRVAMWAIIIFAVLAVLWAMFGRIDVVATAQGKVVPNDRTKTVQSLAPANVKAIHVTDGQAVQAGEVLIELDGTTTQAEQERIRGDLELAQLQVARAQALLMALDSGQLPTLKRLASKQSSQSDPAVFDSALFEQAQRQLLGQWHEYSTQQARLSADLSQREAELRSVQALVRKLEQTLPIAQQRAEDFKNLVTENFISKHGYLEREQARIEQEGDLAAQRSKAKEIEAALRAAQQQRNALTAQTRRAQLDSLTEGEQKVAAFTQEYIKAQSRNQLMQLTAPVAGTVQQLAVHTVGGVVTEAQPLLVIVPRDQPLEVEAFIENKDIGFVKPGQNAQVKIETFQFTKYGTLNATVSSVSHDAINDEKRGLIYSTRVKLDKATINVEGTKVNLSPGMAVTVEVKTGKRRVIEYFLSPLLQKTQESLGER